jgi:hypothetical protein
VEQSHSSAAPRAELASDRSPKARPHFFHWKIGVADSLAHVRAILVSDDQQQHQSGDPVEE